MGGEVAGGGGGADKGRKALSRLPVVKAEIAVTM